MLLDLLAFMGGFRCGELPRPARVHLRPGGVRGAAGIRRAAHPPPRRRRWRGGL
jgi:hypothetical protein